MTVAELPFVLVVKKNNLQQMLIFFKIHMIYGRNYVHNILMNKIYAKEYFSAERIFFRSIEMLQMSVLNC
jgi:hypothetical protein